MKRRDFLKSFAAVTASSLIPSVAWAKTTTPNIIIIFADDLGYGDLSCFGHPTIQTPNLDRMAAQGAKLTQFYAAASVCTPSRAGLMTGRLPIRNGMCSDKRAVLFPDSAGGLPATEITIASMLKQKGYSTACVGKWHLGHLKPFLPTSHGFDSYFGIPYSNDMNLIKGSPRNAKRQPKSEYYDLPLMRDEKVIERPVQQETITKRYCEEAVKFIKNNKDKPFFLYLAHNLPHIPLFRSKEFVDTSLRGIYGDAVQEIDAGIGQIVETLRQQGLAENTLVIFTSDNGPWLTFHDHGGSAGLLRDGKGSTWEGGMREPTIAWWPGTIKSGRLITGIASTLDIFPTCAELAGAKMPTDRKYDGYSMLNMLKGPGKRKRDEMFYYRGQQLQAVRKGPWKIHFYTKTEYVGMKVQKHDPPLLFNVEEDPSEKNEVGRKHPEIITKLKKVASKHQATVKPYPSQLESRIEK